MNYLLLIKVQLDDTNLCTVRKSTRSWLPMPDFEDWGRESRQQNRKVIPDFNSWLLADVRGRIVCPNAAIHPPLSGRVNEQRQLLTLESFGTTLGTLAKICAIASFARELHSSIVLA